MAVKNHFNSVSWNQWDEDIRNREEKAMEHYRELCREEIDFYTWLQYEFYTQWGALKDYANQNGIQIIGDIPIYVAFDSADTWAAPEECSSLMRRTNRRLWQAARLMVFPLQVSCGAILFMIGNIIKRQVISGGSAGSSTALNSMISYVSIISVVLTSIIPFLTGMRLQNSGTGKRDRVSIFSMH